MKKIAILNDIHGNLYLLNQILNYLKDKNIDYFIIGGDYLTDGPGCNDIINIIKKLPATVINGNRELSILEFSKSKKLSKGRNYPMYYIYDQLTEENLEFIKSKNIYETIQIEDQKIVISHGSPYNVRCMNHPYDIGLLEQLIKDFNADIYLFAHIHKNYSNIYKHKKFINAGAVNVAGNSSLLTNFGILLIDGENSTYEQIHLPINFDELKEYYTSSEYHQECFEWSNIILNTIKNGYDYTVNFSNEYDESLTYEENFANFVKNNNLDIY